MAVETFQKYLDENGLSYKVMITDEPTKTAQQAADAHGLPVSNIVKSLLAKVDDHFVLCLVPGDKRLDLDMLRTSENAEEVRMANADEVKEITGYSIGGVPPFGHKSKLPTRIVEGFNEDEMLAAAAGAGNAVFKISLDDLIKIVA